jgi:hypothetical protein
VAWRGWARQIINLIHLKLHWVGNVGAHQFKVGFTQQMFDVSAVAGEEIIQANHLVTGLNQAIAQVGTKKTSAACDQNSFSHGVNVAKALKNCSTARSLAGKMRPWNFHPSIQSPTRRDQIDALLWVQ